MRSTISLDVAAPADLVFELARDVERWPRLLPHYVRVRVLARHADGSKTAEMVARRPLIDVLGLGLPVVWRARTWSEPTLRRLRFRHLGGASAGMDVTWRIEPTDSGCRISIDHDFSRPLRLPVLGAVAGPDVFPSLANRFFVRPIAARTLATFRALAEALATSESSPATYQAT
jgi:ribosome-associated toxin RatA of RatAB toxin-antitoxin module